MKREVPSSIEFPSGIEGTNRLIAAIARCASTALDIYHGDRYEESREIALARLCVALQLNAEQLARLDPHTAHRIDRQIAAVYFQIFFDDHLPTWLELIDNRRKQKPSTAPVSQPSAWR